MSDSTSHTRVAGERDGRKGSINMPRYHAVVRLLREDGDDAHEVTEFNLPEFAADDDNVALELFQSSECPYDGYQLDACPGCGHPVTVYFENSDPDDDD